MILDVQLRFDYRVSGQHVMLNIANQECFTGGGWRGGQLQMATSPLGGGIANAGSQADFSCLPVRAQKDVFYSDLRSQRQLDRLHNPSVVETAARDVINCLVPVRDFLQDIPVDRLVTGFQHPDRQKVACLRLDGVGHIQNERSLRTLVRARIDPVNPHLCQVVHSAETQQVTPLCIGMRRRGKLAPVPDYTVVCRKNLLKDSRHPRRLGLRRRPRKPFPRPPHILRVRRDQPLPV